MADPTDKPGRTTVSPEVLTTIAKHAATSVAGVSRMAGVSGGVNRLFRRGPSDGIRIQAEDNMAFVDLFLVIKRDVNLREVSRNVQQHVARAIQEMVGMDIGRIDIHLEDIDYGEGDGAA